ncbi:GNAT family N-acetyltransferase [Candidatus Villigracilis saccharophilus]|uniref:GNAT family N-acetyltransferase n=1 Tax=Candidatus Villigracilis saccharophilus TaxID=3140684 RepID=UPI003134C285|nr:GNAT family N-acetyltransferase [Anaerolineales bacterium]
MEGDSLFVLTAEELANEWKNEGFNVERDVFVVETSDGRLVGSEEFYNESGHYKLKADGCVHPEFRGLGIGSSLLEKMTERAQAELKLAAPNVRVFIQSLINNKDEAGHNLLKNNGYSLVRYFWRMEIKLQETPPAINLPSGIELRPFIKDEHAVAVWQADDEAFRDHWGSHDRTFQEWSHAKFGNPNFDPTLWMIAWDGNEIAGFSQNRFRKGIGWIGTIAVRRPWRGKGLGIALMHHTFGEFYKRGTAIIGLGVDSANLTGATRLYERAGMYVAGEFSLYEKELRMGES